MLALLAGVDVNVFDPHPEADRVVGEGIANAERAYGLLTEAPLPARRRFPFAASLTQPCRARNGCRRACRNVSTSSAACPAKSMRHARRMR
jgi:hypothetical protein